MSAKRLGRFTAGLFVALGLALGGSLLVAANGPGGVNSTAASAAATQLEYEWS